MNKFKELMNHPISEDKGWDIMFKYFDNYLLSKDKEIHIPKKIHQIWIGEITEDVIKVSEKIKANHPDWEYKLWTDSDLQDYHLINRELFDSETNPGAKSDIARYEIVYNEGGIYLDSDFDMVSSFDEIIKGLEFFSGAGKVTNPEVWNGLFGSVAKHEILEKIVHGLNKETESIMHRTGPYYFSSIIFDYMNNNENSKVVIFPAQYFYPLLADCRFTIWRNGKDSERNLIHSFNSEETVCVHMFDCAWQR